MDRIVLELIKAVVYLSIIIFLYFYEIGNVEEIITEGNDFTWSITVVLCLFIFLALFLNSLKDLREQIKAFSSVKKLNNSD